MNLENWILLFSFTALLTGAFAFGKLWMGALGGCIVLLLGKLFFTPGELVAPLANGTIVFGELILLLFGAYLFYNTLASLNHFDAFIESTAGFPSRLSVVIMLCWFLGSFMEGVAGFGIPAMLIAPLMVTVGYRPLTCVALPLAADTTAVMFGALGTPVKLGMDISVVGPEVRLSLIINILPALLVPLALAWLYGITERKKIDWKTEWPMLVAAGMCFVVPFVLVGQISVEFPSVAAGLIGLVLFVSFSLPKMSRQSYQVWLTIFSPYLLFVGLLVTLKYLLGSIGFSMGEGLKSVSLYQPGLVFIVAIILYLRLVSQKGLLHYIMKQAKITLSRLTVPVLTILFLVIFAQLMRQQMAVLAQQVFSDASQLASLGFVPLAGIFGSFVTGSATMSLLLFSSSVMSLFPAGEPLSLRLALLLTGAAIGNAVSFQNIVMVQSVVSSPVSVSGVLYSNIKFVLVYVCVVIIEGLLFSFLSA